MANIYAKIERKQKIEYEGTIPDF